ncbi:MAG TPA: serine/threonine-protein kinase [Gaiellaceae bacterium]
MNGVSTAGDGELVLGRYRPLSPIGSGGSGSVWLARDEKSGRELALKIVSREGKAGSRAEREAEAASRLCHPHCLRPLDFGYDDQHVYIAYEHVPGKTLRQALRDGEVDDRRAIEICAQVLEALEHAHSNGIVHRDVKPANILLADNGKIDARLADFGLAQFAEAETLTELGDIPGTLAYISPERLAGGDSSTATDVWAVGVALWEALVGWHPFWAGSLLETARRIETGAPSLESMRPDLPRPLLAAVERALAREPKDRPSAGDFAAVLRRLLNQEARERRKPKKPLTRSDLRFDPARLAHALASAAVVAWGISLFPFYPAHSQLLLALLAGAVSLLRPLAGSALTYSLLLLPLGNYSLGLALAFALVATCWLAVNRRDPLLTQLPLLGPIAAVLGALFLLPLALLPIRGGIRRALIAFCAFSLALVTAGMGSGVFPLTGAKAPLGLGIGNSTSLTDAGGALTRALFDQPALLAQGLLLALAAALLPLARRKGRWGLALFGAVLIAGALIPFPDVMATPVILGTWLTTLALTLLPASVSAARPVVTAPAKAPLVEPRRIAV